MELSFDKLKERYLTLPEELKNTISSPEAAEALYEIGTANKLRIDEMDVLSKQTGFVLLGVTHPNEFVSRLKDALPMSRDKVDAIAAAVNEKIFAPIHASIVSMHKQEPVVNTGATEKPASPAATNVPRTLGSDMTQVKMSGTFHLPPDKVAVKAAAPVRDGKYAAADPYREPTN